MSDVTEHEDDQTTILTDENRQNDPDDDATEEEAGLTELQVNIEEATRRFNERFPPTELRGNVTTRRSEGYVDPLTSMAEDVISLPRTNMIRRSFASLLSTDLSKNIAFMAFTQALTLKKDC